MVPEEATNSLEMLFRNAGLAAPSPEMASSLLHGILGQLRSLPIGLRVDDWLFQEYPEIRPPQVRGALEQLAEYSSVLSSPIRAMVPPPIDHANTAMNSAFALYWARSIADESVALPYKAIGVTGAGNELLATLDQSLPSASHDTSLVDAWADQLGLTGWDRWAEYELDS